MFKAPKTETSSEFYDDLMRGEKTRGIFGKDTRFSATRVASLPSVQRFFVDVIRPLIDPSDRVLDFGCGPGCFLLCAAPLCGEIVGADISQGFVDQANATIEECGLTHARVLQASPGNLPFEDGHFDVLLMVDLIHHLEDMHTNLKEAFRVLKPGGRVIVFEPSKLNPILYVMCLFDRNERGLLALGTPRKYRKLLSPYMTDITVDFNGVVIGPESRLWTLAAATMNARLLKPLLGWLNPKMIITGTKPADSPAPDAGPDSGGATRD